MRNARDVGFMRRIPLNQMMFMMNGSFVLLISEMENVHERRRRNLLLLFYVRTATLKNQNQVSLLLCKLA